MNLFWPDESSCCNESAVGKMELLPAAKPGDRRGLGEGGGGGELRRWQMCALAGRTHWKPQR